MRRFLNTAIVIQEIHSEAPRKKCSSIFENVWNTYREIKLTHYSPVLLFYTLWKHQKTFRFPGVFRGYRKPTPGCNKLNLICIETLTFWKVAFICTLKTKIEKKKKKGVLFYFFSLLLSKEFGIEKCSKLHYLKSISLPKPFHFYQIEFLSRRFYPTFS